MTTENTNPNRKTRYVEVDGHTFGLWRIGEDETHIEYEVGDLVSIHNGEHYFPLDNMKVLKSAIDVIGKPSAIEATLRKHMKEFYAS